MDESSKTASPLCESCRRQKGEKFMDMRYLCIYVVLLFSLDKAFRFIFT